MLIETAITVRLNDAMCRAIEGMPVPAKPDPRPEPPRMNTCEVAPRLLQFDAPLTAVTRGYNTVALTVEQGGPQIVIWLEIFLNQ